MSKAIHRIIFPKKGDHWKWFVLFLICIPVPLLFSPAAGILETNYLHMIICLPLFGKAYSEIREAQVCPIDEDDRSKYLNLKLRTRRSMGLIGLFIPALSLTVVHVSDMLFWILYGLLSLVSTSLMLLASVISRIFLVLSVVYLVSYFILAGFITGNLPVGITFILGLIMLPSSIAEIIFTRRVILANVVTGNAVAPNTRE